MITPAAPIPSIQIPRSTTRWSRIFQSGYAASAAAAVVVLVAVGALGINRRLGEEIDLLRTDLDAEAAAVAACAPNFLQRLSIRKPGSLP